MIHPIADETFLREYWGQKPLVIERGQPDYYAGLLSLADLDAIVGFRQLKYSQLKLARSDQAQPDTVFYVDADATSDTNRLFHSYAEGNTVALNFTQCYWEPIARLCSAFEHAFHFPAGANVYVTPRNAQGFPPHFDAHDVFVLQVEGTKRWRLYPDAAVPVRGQKDNEPIPRERLGDAQLELCLRAGDLLYIPRGCVHEARTTDSSSVHVTVGVRAYTWADLLNELVEAASEQDAALHEPLPVRFMQGQAAGPMHERMPALLAMLASGERIESGIARLGERLLERMRPLADAHFRSLDRADEIDLDTPIAKREGMLCRVARKAEFVEIAFPGNRMRGPREIEPAFRFIAEAKGPFTVRALPDVLSDRSKLVLARRAIREGLLRIADAG